MNCSSSVVKGECNSRNKTTFAITIPLTFRWIGVGVNVMNNGDEREEREEREEKGDQQSGRINKRRFSSRNSTP